MKTTAERLETRPKLIIGWLVASDLRDPELLEIYARARSLLTEQPGARSSRRISALGVPSSALEVAALSSARLGRKDENLAERLAALAQHLLGHLFTLETRDEGPMRPPGEVEDLRLYPFPKDGATGPGASRPSSAGSRRR